MQYVVAIVLVLAALLVLRALFGILSHLVSGLSGAFSSPGQVVALIVVSLIIVALIMLAYYEISHYLHRGRFHFLTIAPPPTPTAESPSPLLPRTTWQRPPPEPSAEAPPNTPSDTPPEPFPEPVPEWFAEPVPEPVAARAPVEPLPEPAPLFTPRTPVSSPPPDVEPTPLPKRKPRTTTVDDAPHPRAQPTDVPARGKTPAPPTAEGATEPGPTAAAASTAGASTAGASTAGASTAGAGAAGSAGQVEAEAASEAGGASSDWLVNARLLIAPDPVLDAEYPRALGDSFHLFGFHVRTPNLDLTGRLADEDVRAAAGRLAAEPENEGLRLAFVTALTTDGLFLNESSVVLRVSIIDAAGSAVRDLLAGLVLITTSRGVEVGDRTAHDGHFVHVVDPAPGPRALLSGNTRLASALVNAAFPLAGADSSALDGRLLATIDGLEADDVDQFAARRKPTSPPNSTTNAPLVIDSNSGAVARSHPSAENPPATGTPAATGTHPDQTAPSIAS